MNPQDICDTGLSLALAIGPTTAPLPPDLRRRRSPLSSKPSLTLSLTPDVMQRDGAAVISRGREEGPPPTPPPTATQQRQQLPSPCSAASSFVAVCVKKEKEAEAEAEAAERGSSRGSDEEDNTSSARKKLRLTKEQSALLEDRFKEHSTLNPKQKQALAKQLNLRPRQVEVWFQNRRARTKLKQTEVDCEFLKRCYETLTSENLRLQKELQELKALKFSPPSAAPAVPPLYMQFPAATLTMCPSCERMGGGSGVAPTPAAGAAAAELGGGSAAAGSVVAVPAKTGHFFNPFTHSSAAC